MYELRALTIGEILDHSFTLYRRHFGTFLAIAAVSTGPAAAVQVYVSLGGGAALHPMAALMYLLLSFIGGLIGSGATVSVISDIYLSRDVQLRSALARAFAKAGRLFVAGFAWGLMMMLGFFLLIIPGFVFACRYALVYPITVLEPLESGTAALGRSRELTMGFKWKVFGALAVITCIIMVPMVAVVALLPTTMGQVGSVLVSMIVSPLIYGVLTLLYYDLRVRKEGFDLEVLGQQTLRNVA